jgi:hypothetical protein
MDPVTSEGSDHEIILGQRALFLGGRVTRIGPYVAVVNAEVPHRPSSKGTLEVTGKLAVLRLFWLLTQPWEA